MTAVSDPEPDAILAQSQARRDLMDRLRRDVHALQVTGYSRHHEISVTVRGDAVFTDILIDERDARRCNVHELGDIVTEALNDALDRLAERSAAVYTAQLDRDPADGNLSPQR
jgi:DNA-binding protein YbaB